MRRRFASRMAMGLLTAAVAGRAQSPADYGSLLAFVSDLKLVIPRAGSEAFIEPSQADLDAFRSCMDGFFAGDATNATICFDGLGYDLGVLSDAAYGKSYLVAQERQVGFRGLGTYVVDPAFARNLLVEVPHPLWDINTPEEGTRIFQDAGARALLIAGTHRCANLSTASACSGTTAACWSGTQPVRISDAPHFTRNFMHVAHEASLLLLFPPVALNLHGNASEPADVVLSDGTKEPAPETALVNQLRNALASRNIAVASCNRAADDPSTLSLCGTTNAQGRASNGSADACLFPATGATGAFLHIEQHRNVRDDPSVLIGALLEVFP